MGLFISNVAGLGDCHPLATCKAFFGLDRCDKRDKSRYIIKLKWSIINNHHKVCIENIIVEWLRNWGKFLIGQFLPLDSCMNKTTISMISNILQQKKIIFISLLGRKTKPRESDENTCTRFSLFSKNRNLYT